MPVEWYYQTTEGDVVGPFSSSKLKHLADNHILHAATLVRKGADGRWVHANQVKGLFSPATSTGEESSEVAQPVPPPAPQSLEPRHEAVEIGASNQPPPLASGPPPHASSLRNRMRLFANRWIIGGGIATALVVFGVAYMLFHESEEQKAIASAEQYIRSCMLSPSNTVFQEENIVVTPVSEERFLVSGTYDAPNRFGGMMRGEYDVLFQRDPLRRVMIKLNGEIYAVADECSDEFEISSEFRDDAEDLDDEQEQPIDAIYDGQARCVAELDHIRIEIGRIDCTKVQKTADAQILPASFSKERVLRLTVAVSNISEHKRINYRHMRAYGSGFHPYCTDEYDNKYGIPRLEGNAVPFMQKKDSFSLYPRQGVRDVWIFERPVEGAQELTLVIPATAYDTSRDITIKIKANTIRNGKGTFCSFDEFKRMCGMRPDEEFLSADPDSASMDYHPKFILFSAAAGAIWNAEGEPLEQGDEFKPLDF